MRAAVLQGYGEPLSVESVDASDPDPEDVSEKLEAMSEYDTVAIPVIDSC